VCHLGFVSDDHPYVIPTLYARRDDDVYVHGSSASRMLRTLDGGADACLTVTLIDGIVLARSIFNHSINYRSVVVLGRATAVPDVDEKRRALAAFSGRLLPGRWADVRPPTATELKATSILRLRWTRHRQRCAAAHRRTTRRTTVGRSGPASSRWHSPPASRNRTPCSRTVSTRPSGRRRPVRPRHLAKKANSRRSNAAVEPKRCSSVTVAARTGHAFEGMVASDDNRPKEVTMFTRLTAELLDLVVQEKGYRLALYAANGSDGGSSCVGCCCCCCSN
jgi:nitroimidazol reductase NimA-like FMN-containing flavoprotein (pyridoxamine 5'-phosphate oxidase superfamily)